MKPTLLLLFMPAAALGTLPCLAATPAAERAASAPAEDRAEIDTTRILGQRELPKVLTIVPWKPPQPGPASTRPLVSVLDEALAPVDRDVLRRELGYHAQLRDRALAALARAAANATPAPER